LFEEFRGVLPAQLAERFNLVGQVRDFRKKERRHSRTEAKSEKTLVRQGDYVTVNGHQSDDAESGWLVVSRGEENVHAAIRENAADARSGARFGPPTALYIRG